MVQARAEERIARRAFWVSAGVLGLVLLSSVVAAFPANVLKPTNNPGALTVVSEVFPQGWAFFTKDPQDVEFVAYRPTEGGLESLLATPQSRAENLWGLSRTQRAQGPELVALGNDATWVECVSGQVPLDCYEQGADYVPTVNPMTHPTLCGDVVLVEEKPVAWSFRNMVKGTHTAERVAYESIECKGKML